MFRSYFGRLYIERKFFSKGVFNETFLFRIMINIMRPDEGRVVYSTTISGVSDVNVAHADINISVQSVTNNTVPS